MKPPPVPGVPRVVCNRPVGHDGSHRRYRQHDFVLLYEWTQADGYLGGIKAPQETA